MLFTLWALSFITHASSIFCFWFCIKLIKKWRLKKWKPCWNMNRHYHHYHYLVRGSELGPHVYWEDTYHCFITPALDWVRMMSSICLLPYLSTFCHLSPWHSLSAMLLHFLYLLIEVSSRSHSCSVPHKHSEAYINYKLTDLLAQAY